MKGKGEEKSKEKGKSGIKRRMGKGEM